MIASFTHKGLEDFFSRGSPKGIVISHTRRLREILRILNKISSPYELKGLYPGAFCHSIAKQQGNRRGYYAMKINANWRLTFKFDDVTQTVEELDYIDYH